MVLWILVTFFFWVNNSSTGRPNTVSLANLLTLKRAVERDPFATARMIRSKFVSLHHLSIRTIRRVISVDLRFRACRPAKKPVLTPRMLDDRIRFCNRYQNWLPSDWDKVLFSDEVRILTLCTKFVFSQD